MVTGGKYRLKRRVLYQQGCLPSMFQSFAKMMRHVLLSNIYTFNNMMFTSVAFIQEIKHLYP